MARMLLIAVALIAASLTGRAVAQTPPDAAELAAYRGLHAAAASGDVAAIRKLAGAGEGLDQRDGNGRAPLHVAAFRGQVEAIRALIGAGADPGCSTTSAMTRSPSSPLPTMFRR